MNHPDLAIALWGLTLDSRLPIIDLHQATNLGAALEQFDREFDRLARTNPRGCRIIYGVGEGILGREIGRKLAKDSRIIGFKEEENGGSCVVLF